MLERLIAAVVALAIVLPTLIYGGTIGFFILGLVIVAIGSGELWKMFSNHNDFPSALRWVLTLIYVAVFAGLFFWTSAMTPILISACLLLWITGLFGVPDNDLGMKWAAYSTFGLMYLPFLLSTFIQVRAVEGYGLQWLFLTLLLTWSADSGAYFAGRTFGKTKLFERVSPKKTMEGVAGGVLLAIVVGVFYCGAWLPMVPMWVAGTMGVLWAILSVVGDLVESMMKRAFGVKDSGNIMPGHGGVVDRLDSLLFTFPATWLFIEYGLDIVKVAG
jgi:phosphatidate cytidylyltransferase